MAKRLYFFEEIKQHNFFKAINFDMLESMYLKSPYIPNLEKMKFEHSANMENILKFLADNPNEVELSGIKIKLPKKWDDFFSI